MKPDLETLRTIFLKEEPKALLDLCPEKDPETHLFPVRIHDEAGNQLAEASFPTKEEATEFVNYLIGEATTQAIKKLTDNSETIRWKSTLYTITEKNFSPGEFPPTKEEIILLLSDGENKMRLHKIDTHLLKVHGNEVTCPSKPELPPLEFFKLTPTHI
jgi:hypothetical protein